MPKNAQNYIISIKVRNEKMKQMKTKYYLIVILLITVNNIKAQDRLMKDLDGDGINDFVYFETESSSIVSRLSIQGFKKVSSKPIENLNMQSSVIRTENGFEFVNDRTRSGYKNQFLYNPKTQKMQLIGMSRYEFGDAVNDLTGESVVDLLTGNYVGNWNNYDSEKDTLIGMPPIYANLDFETINFEDFGEDTFFDYTEKCTKLYNSIRQLDSEQKNAFFRDESIQRIDLENIDTITLRFEPVSEEIFLKLKVFQSYQPGSSLDFSWMNYPDISFSLATQNRHYNFIGDRSGQEYRYIGYVPEINSHIISECKWVCVNYLLDNETDEKMMLPDTFDGGVSGLKISASQKQVLMYLSYDGANYADYYPHRAEIIFMQIGEGKGFHELTNPKICIITEWSIEEIVWIDEKSIALKVYDKHEEVSNGRYYYHEPVYQYFKTEIK